MDYKKIWFKISFIVKAIRNAKSAGFDALDADLMVGLPTQTLSDVGDDIGKLIALGPNEITIHPLGLKNGTPMYSLLKDNPNIFPSQESGFLMRVVAQECLTNGGYAMWLPKHYGLQNGRRFRYETLRRDPKNNLVVAGLSSSGYYNGFQYGNVRDFSDYYAAIDEGALPLLAGVKVSGDEHMRRWMIMGLRTPEGVNIKSFTREFGVSPKEVFPKELSELESQGVVVAGVDSLRCSKIGMYFADYAATRFISDDVSGN